MKKKELKQCLQIYAKIKKALQNRNNTVEIKRKKRTERIEIKPWMYKLPEYLGLLEKAESVLIRDLIRESIRNGENDQKVLWRLPVSESTFYRWKRQIIDKIYDLYILSGDVSAEEILLNRIE